MILPVKGLIINGINIEGMTVDVPLSQGPGIPPTAVGEVIDEEIHEFDPKPIIGGTGGESNQAYSTNRGFYVRGKHWVKCWMYFQFANRGTIDGELLIKNLPFKAAYVPMFFAGHCPYCTNASPDMAQVTSIGIYTGGTLQTAKIMGFIAGKNPMPLEAKHLNDHTQLIFNIDYPID